MRPEVEAEVYAAVEAARRATGPGATGPLPVRDYLDEGVYRAELARAIRPSWIPLARGSELPEPGAFVTRELAGDALALVRGDDGALRVFHNVCRHRGAQVLRAERGCARTLTCPYHGFVYGLDGVLGSLVAPDSFPERVAAGRTRLAPVRHAEWGGWVWVCLDARAPAFDDYLGAELLDELRNWPFADVERKAWRVVDAPFGWKVAVEAFLEPLHVPAIHPRTAHPLVDYRGMAVRELGEHSRMALPFRLPGAYAPDGPLGSEAARAGVPLFPRLNDAQRQMHFVYLVFPATILLLLPHHFLFFTALPTAVDRCRFTYELYAMPAADEAAAAYHRSVAAGYERLVDEDLENLPWIQRGLGDSSLERVELSRFEQRIRHFREQLRRRLER